MTPLQEVEAFAALAFELYAGARVMRGATALTQTKICNFLKNKSSLYKFRPVQRVIDAVLRGCFVAGTLIATADGARPIETIRTGDLVWARDTTTGWEDLQPVLNTFTRQAGETVVITYDAGSVEATREHPFWVADRGWVPAAKLQEGDQLSGREGMAFTVHALTTRTVNQTVYNLEIAEFHTYHVADGELLVHNGCGVPKTRTIRGWKYTLDENGKTQSTEGYVRLYKRHKRPGDAEKAAVQGKRATDQIGHLNGHSHSGPSDSINLEAQDGWANSNPASPWWQREKFFTDQRKLHGPKSVYTKKTITGRDSTGRPTGVFVEWWVNGQYGSENYPHW